METQEENKKSFFKRFWWIILIVIISGIIVLSIFNNINDKRQKEQKSNQVDKGFNWPSTTAKYITAVPVDLTQIESISKYRSCAGHIRDGYSFEGDLESDRSMKHYLLPVDAFKNTNDQVKIFAPFDGIVIKIDQEKDIKVGDEAILSGMGIHLSTSVDPNIDFVFGHVFLVRNFKVGDTVKAGELLGYAATGCGKNGGRTGCTFDIDLSTPGGVTAYNNREVLGSVFDHMTDLVLAEFAKYGVTPENTKFTKEYRDTHPCKYEGPNKDRSELGTLPDTTIKLTN